MTLPDEAGRELDQALRRVAIEHQRAARAAEIAQRHERRTAADPDSLRAFHLRMAQMHRQAERQHLAAARMHAAHADRLRRWAAYGDHERALPRFMATVAAAVGARGAAVTLFGPDKTETLTAASDLAAQNAQDLEFTLGEGPARDAAEQSRPIAATGPALLERWSNYGPAVVALGIRSVAAVPLQISSIPLGALTAFDPPREPAGENLEPIHAAADTIALSVLMAAGEGDAEQAPDLQSLFGQADRRAVVHQAAGVVAERNGCTIADALALIRAHAFAEGEPVDSVASDIMHHGRRLT
jgi:hypothetical protein